MVRKILLSLLLAILVVEVASADEGHSANVTEVMPGCRALMADCSQNQHSQDPQLPTAPIKVGECAGIISGLFLRLACSTLSAMTVYRKSPRANSPAFCATRPRSISDCPASHRGK
jgi:hypothetical protein